MQGTAEAWVLSPRNLICGILAILGVLQFAITVLYAMHEYPGGYDIQYHFLSDLGRTRTQNGLDNWYCSSLFNRSVMLLGLSLLPLFIVLPSAFDSGRLVTSLAGFASLLGLVGIGATPCDKHMPEHIAALTLWLLSTLVLVTVIFVYFQANWGPSIVLGAVSLFVLTAAWKYVVGGSHGDRVVFQKVFAMACVCWLGVVIPVASLLKVTLISSLHQRQAKLATKYMNQLSRGHRRR